MAGMTQRTLARELNVTYQQLQKYEKGTNQPSIAQLYTAARILEIPINYFFDGLSEGADLSSDGAPVTNADSLTRFVLSPEGAILCGAFMQINALQRRRVVKLVISMVADELREEGGPPAST
jgi:transcriptional regulator with XRE-family HTH domain